MGTFSEFNEKFEAFPDAMNRRRRTIGMTNAECAELTGLTETQISRFLSGATKNPNFYSVVALCKCLNFSLEDYFFGDKSADLDDNTQIMLMEKDIEYLKKREESLLKIVNDLKKSRNHMFYMNLISVAVFFIIFIVCDLINPYFGFIYRG